MAEQGESIPNVLGATDFLWQWGQFLDHTIGLRQAGLLACDFEIKGKLIRH